MRHTTRGLLLAVTLTCAAAQAAVTAEEAAKLKSTLTPFGGEKAGNADGSIPAWTGGYTTPIPGFKQGGRRGDPFAADKPLYSVTAENMAQYTSRLTEGTQALLKKYPKTFRLDVYQTRRTAAAPQWVYDNTFKNATTGTLVDNVASNVYGGIPFPIPKTGEEMMTNHLLRWRGEAWEMKMDGYVGTANGGRVLSVTGTVHIQMPYYVRGARDKFGDLFWAVRVINDGPPVRAGEMITGNEHLDYKRTVGWAYLTGQRRVRKLPNTCCDTPTPATSGVASFDEVDVFTGRTSMYDWSIVGKREMLIPYNSNRLNTPTRIEDVMMPHHINPDHVRWELHRVWVVEGKLREGKRLQAARSRYYLDEDTWAAVLADRWDAKGQLWKTLWAHPIVMPDVPATVPGQEWGFNDLLSGTWYVSSLRNAPGRYLRIVPPRPDTFFTPEAMAGAAIR